MRPYTNNLFHRMHRKLLLNLRSLYSPDFLIFVAIFLFALGLRVYGARGSLPYVGHPDEPDLVDAATRIVKSGDLNPHTYLYPSLYIYLEALVIRAHLLWGIFRGYYTGPQSLPDVSHVFSLAPGVYVWVRTFAAIVGALNVSLLYVVGREMFNGSRRVGLVAALMLAVSPLHVEYSHFGMTDMPLALMGLLVLWVSYRLSRIRVENNEDERNLIWYCMLCGLLVGMTAATKYNGIGVIVVPLVAWFMQWRRSPRRTTDDRRWTIENTHNQQSNMSYRPSSIVHRLSSLVAIPMAALVGFVLCEPYALLDWPSFYAGSTHQVSVQEPVRHLADIWTSIGSYVTDLSADNGYFFVPTIMGVIVLLVNPPVRNRAWLLIPFPLVYLLALSRFSVTHVRNLIIVLPFLALISGYTVDLAATQITSMIRSSIPALPLSVNRHLWGLVRWDAVAVVLWLVLAQPLNTATSYSSYQATPDSRNLAWAWVQERMRTGDRFAAELHPWQTQDWPDVLAFDVENPQTATPLTIRPPDWYAKHGYNYVVLNSNYKDAWRDPAFWAEYKKLPTAKEFPGDKGGGKGPVITVVATTSTGKIQLPMLHPLDADVQDFATLVGYDLVPLTSTNVLADPLQVPITGTGAFKAGQAVGLNLYYRARRGGKPSDLNWQVWVHLIDAASENTVAQVDVQPLTGQLSNYPQVVHEPHPVSKWHEGELLAGVYNFSLPSEVRAGTYHIETGMWVPPNGPGAQIAYDPQNKPASDAPTDRVILGNISVSP